MTNLTSVEKRKTGEYIFNNYSCNWHFPWPFHATAIFVKFPAREYDYSAISHLEGPDYFPASLV